MRLPWFLPVLAGIGLAQTLKVPTLSLWNFQPVNSPAAELRGIVVHPDDDNLWFVPAGDGLYVTRNGGQTWTHPITGIMGSKPVRVDPNSHNRVYAAAQQTLYLSQDSGVTWAPIAQFRDLTWSVLVSARDSAVFVGTVNSLTFNGLYKSTDQGRTFVPHSFNYIHNNLIPWGVEKDTSSGAIFVGIEIADHPAPYQPPV